MSAPHTDLVSRCLVTASGMGAMVWRNETGRARSLDGRRIISYGLTGSSDILGLTPAGRFLAIECKVGRDTLRTDQARFRDAVLARGGLHIVARHPDDVVAAMSGGPDAP